MIAVSRDSKEPVKKEVVKTTQPEKDTLEPLVPQEALEVKKKPDFHEALARTTADVYFDAGNEFLKNRLWDEAIEKFDWGHSSFSLAVEFAAEWKIERLVMFHHEPLYDDKKIYSILDKARWYASHQNSYKPELILAREGLEIEV